MVECRGRGGGVSCFVVAALTWLVELMIVNGKRGREEKIEKGGRGSDVLFANVSLESSFIFCLTAKRISCSCILIVV